MTSVSVIGAGAMGASLAVTFSRSGCSIRLLATEFDGPVVEAINAAGLHPALNHPLPEDVEIVLPDSWPEALRKSQVVVVAVSSAGVRSVVAKCAPHLAPEAVWAVATKGWDPRSAEPMSVVIAQESGSHPVVIMVGPSLARELIAGTPTAMVCASTDLEAARKVAEAISSDGVRAFTNSDVVGVEVGASLKNVLAIAIGLCDGVAELKGRSMSNTKAALFSRGLIEMARLAVALGGRESTVLGLAGAGDLFVTVIGGRNGRFGKLVGSGLDPQRAFEEMGTTVEGYENTREAVVLGERYELDLPVVQMVHEVLYGGRNADEAISAFITGPCEEELVS